MLRLAITGLLLSWTLSELVTAADAPKPPNIIFIITDDQGYGDLSCHGNPILKTPNIDRLHHEGVRFTDFYVAQAVCSASRTAWLTGCYPNRLGIHGALGPGSKVGIVLLPCKAAISSSPTHSK